MPKRNDEAGKMGPKDAQIKPPPTVLAEVETYVVQFAHGPAIRKEQEARVFLRFKDRSECWGAWLYFMADGENLRERNEVTRSNNLWVFSLYFRSEILGAVLDVLRNEKPVFFRYTERTNDFRITTAHEPIGEEEGG
jgi:hypothetical protein